MARSVYSIIRLAGVAALLLMGASRVSAAAPARWVGEADEPGGVRLVLAGAAADVYVDAADHKLARIAARLLTEDVERVTGRKPALRNDAAGLSRHAVLVGTLGRSELIDQLAMAGKLDVTGVAGQWESFVLQVVDAPLAGVERALVIAGSDRRGTAFGVFELSEQIGVSPWYFWADVAPDPAEALIVRPGTRKQGPPSVKYRGIFINDEDWGLQRWAARTFDPAFGDIGPRTYERVFELLLRLKANHLWPAMHGCTIEFGAVDENVRLADEWGIVMGAAHCEPLNRNNVWWKTDGTGEWRYDTNRAGMMKYWEEWARKRGEYEAVWTVGMRGIHDSGMPGPKDIRGQVRLLEQAIDDQRDLLKKHVAPDVERVPQVFTPYKEALTHYQNGLTLPEDVTILWCEDNYGYIRQLSSPAEQKRPGGSGVYYHISYLGWPRPYLWLNTTPPALIWEEMSKAHAYGADRIWMLNVGDIKPGEIGTEFWMRLAWDVDRYGRDAQPTFLKEWAARDFGLDVADEIAAVMGDYYRLGLQRKPELMADDAFSAVHYGEAERRLAEYASVLDRAESLSQRVPPHKRDAFYQLVLYPVRIAALVNDVFAQADLSRLYAKQGRVVANDHAAASERAVKRIEAETAYYNNELAGGKWRHMMTVKGMGGRWNVQWPARGRVEPTPEPHLGVAVEGQGLPLLSDRVRQAVSGTTIDIAAADAAFEPPIELRQTEDGVAHLVVPNQSSGRSPGNTLTPGAGAKATFAFSVPEPGKYNLFLLVNCPTMEDDSWFVLLDDGPWVEWNGVGTRSSWDWHKQGEYELAAGNHMLTLANREDGAMVARVRLTDHPGPQLLAEISPGATPARLPSFDRHTKRRHFIEVYNTSVQPFAFGAAPSADWIRIADVPDQVTDQHRLGVDVDWSKLPEGQDAVGTITLSGAGEEHTVEVRARNPATSHDIAPHVETNGYVSIEAEHATRITRGSDGTAWKPIADLGRTGDAMAVFPVTAASRSDAGEIVKTSPAMEYDVTMFSAGEVAVTAYCLPTHRIHEGRGLRYGVSIDDQPPTIVDFYESGGHGGENSPRWRDNVTRNAAVNVTRHTVAQPGRHTLKVWMVDPGVVVDKLVIDTGGLKPSELGPPETTVSVTGAGERAE